MLDAAGALLVIGQLQQIGVPRRQTGKRELGNAKCGLAHRALLAYQLIMANHKAKGPGTPGRPESEVREREDSERPAVARAVSLQAGGVNLQGDLIIPAGAVGIVLFAHGSGSSRHSPRNRFVAETIREAGAGTLLFDLLTREEEADDAQTGHLRFNIGLLVERLIAATEWVGAQKATQHLGVGYFGSSTGGAAALVAAGAIGSMVDAVVSRGGRPDLAGDALPRVEAPTLLIVGERDDVVLRLNREAYAQLRCEKEIAVVAKATHLFEEPGTLEEVAQLAAGWFRRHLRSR